MNKTVLLASFIFPERLNWFLNYLNEKHNISKNYVFGYKNLDDLSKIIVTFKFKIPENTRPNFRELFPNPILIHKRGNAIYTINALNKLIEEQNKELIGNIDYKTITIDWNLYQNKLILISNNELSITNISRIF